MVLPGIEEYNKHKDDSKIKATLNAFIPALCYIGMLLIGIILFEFIPRIFGGLLENLFQ